MQHFLPVAARAATHCALDKVLSLLLLLLLLQASTALATTRS
jgi:hypothetical protein